MKWSWENVRLENQLFPLSLQFGEFTVLCFLTEDFLEYRKKRVNHWISVSCSVELVKRSVGKYFVSIPRFFVLLQLWAPPAAPAKSLRKNCVRVVLSIVSRVRPMGSLFFCVPTGGGSGGEPIRTIFYTSDRGGAAALWLPLLSIMTIWSLGKSYSRVKINKYHTGIAKLNKTLGFTI